MAALYVTSISEKSGKTMLCAGLGKYWQNSGKKVGYLKLTTGGSGKKPGSDNDNAFIQKLLGLTERAESSINKSQEIKSVYSGISAGKDVVIIEGLSLSDAFATIEALEAAVLVVHDYAKPLSEGEVVYKKLGRSLLGVVLNKVPGRKLSAVQDQTAGELQEAGINLLGVIPEDRKLLSFTVAELAELLAGKILNNAEKADELVENIMLGAMTFDSGLEYFNRKNNKAVILKGERPDMQMAALETSTRCIVLTGGVQPMPVVARQAAVKKVPLISVQGDVSESLSVLEKNVNEFKFGQEKKMPFLLGIMRQRLNLDYLNQRLGIAA